MTTIDLGNANWGLTLITNARTGIAVSIMETDLHTWETSCCGLIDTFPCFHDAFEWAMQLAA